MRFAHLGHDFTINEPLENANDRDVLRFLLKHAMTDLERSHAEFRAALMLAGKRIVKLNFGKRDDPVLVILRRVLREARAVAKQEGLEVRIRLR
ncbi:MAG: hypothetical protein ABSG26_05785 [Bryobacteraceae bacterium]